MRSDYQFRIFHWTESKINPDKMDHDHNPLPRTKHLLAQSDPVTFEPGRGPEQVHLALTDGDGEMRVMFVTHDGKESFVKYRLAWDGLDRVVGTEVARYEREDMCDSPANDSVGWREKILHETGGSHFTITIMNSPVFIVSVHITVSRWSAIN